MKLTFIVLFCGAPLTQAYLLLKLQVWFPRYEQRWIEAAATCQQQLEHYWQNNRTIYDTPCSSAADCILQNIPGTIQSNFNSAQILLGLLPAILVYLGPTTAEVAVLSTYRPLLATLLALGSPAVNIARVLRHVVVKEPFTQPMSRTSYVWSTWLARQNVVVHGSLRALSYVAAFAAMANNTWNSVYLDLRTISGWRCGALLMPLVWSLLAVVVHAWGMAAIRVQSPEGFQPSIRSVVRSTAFRTASKGSEGVLSEILLWVGSLFAVVHLSFGVFVLSSLVFVSAPEAVGIFLRFALSALLCQIVVKMELGNMRCEMGMASDVASSPNVLVATTTA
ncbi:MAG: hypothetical protein Q9221_005166 [Calogaya cf. arnoldii]